MHLTFVHSIICGVLFTAMAASIAAALASSGLDYTNSVLYGLPFKCLARLHYYYDNRFFGLLSRTTLVSRYQMDKPF